MEPVSHGTRQLSIRSGPMRVGSPISCADDARSEVDGGGKTGFFPYDAATARQYVCAAPTGNNDLSGAIARCIRAYSQAWEAWIGAVIKGDPLPLFLPVALLFQVFLRCRHSLPCSGETFAMASLLMLFRTVLMCAPLAAPHASPACGAPASKSRTS